MLADAWKACAHLDWNAAPVAIAGSVRIRPARDVSRDGTHCLYGDRLRVDKRWRRRRRRVCLSEVSGSQRHVPRLALALRAQGRNQGVAGSRACNHGVTGKRGL
jgi:hypothetical protein